MLEDSKTQKILVVGAGPVGALAALYAAKRGDDVHVYELRAGKHSFSLTSHRSIQTLLRISYLFLCFKKNPCLGLRSGILKKHYLDQVNLKCPFLVHIHIYISYKQKVSDLLLQSALMPLGHV